jgi:hypothetical protein
MSLSLTGISMRKCLPLSCAIVLALALGACTIGSVDDPGPYKPVIQVTGSVTDSATGLPLAGSTVRLVAFNFVGGDRIMGTTAADGEGHFLLSGRADDDCPFDIVITASKSGYYDLSSWFYRGPTIRCTDDLQTVNVSLARR